MSVNHSWTWHKLREDLRRTITGAQALAFSRGVFWPHIGLVVNLH